MVSETKAVRNFYDSLLLNAFASFSLMSVIADQVCFSGTTERGYTREPCFWGAPKVMSHAGHAEVLGRLTWTFVETDCYLYLLIRSSHTFEQRLPDLQIEYFY